MGKPIVRVSIDGGEYVTVTNVNVVIDNVGIAENKQGVPLQSSIYVDEEGISRGVYDVTNQETLADRRESHKKTVLALIANPR